MAKDGEEVVVVVHTMAQGKNNAAMAGGYPKAASVMSYGKFARMRCMG